MSTDPPTIPTLPANGKAGIREVYKEIIEVRKEMYAYHLTAMTEITKLKVMAVVYGSAAGTVATIIIKIVLDQMLG